ncbi:phytase [Herbidospora sp. RD11066]
MKSTPRAALALGVLATVLLSAAPASAEGPKVVTTDNETPVLYDDDKGGNASGDDPAIWVHPRDSRKSIVIVTAKEGGLRVYDLTSRELQSLKATKAPRKDAVDGRYNNVDIAYGVRLEGRKVDVAVVSDRYNDQIRFFAIDPSGSSARKPLREVTARDQKFLFSKDRDEADEEHTAYGLAVYQPKPGVSYAVVTQEGATTIATARIVEKNGKLGYSDIRRKTMPARFPLPDGSIWKPCDEPGALPHFEGLSVDQRSGTLYAAQEDIGLWRMQLPLGSTEPKLIDKVKNFGIEATYDEKTEECTPVDPKATGFGGDNLTADAEGVDIYYAGGSAGYVIVSSQGDDTFTVYDRRGANKALGTFRVKGVKGADDINGSDGLTVTNRPVGKYTKGLLVTHDEPDTGSNVNEERDATNFSYVSWGDVARALKLKVDTGRGNGPRF